MKKILGLLVCGLLLAGATAVQKKTAVAPSTAKAGALADLAWMEGTWARVDGDELVEETWSSPVGDAMVGMLRWSRGGSTWLYELMSIEAEEGKPVFRLRHFSRGLEPWESEKDGPLTYPLLFLGENEVVFENPDRDEPRRFVYRRSGDELSLRLEAAEGGGSEFLFRAKARQ